MNDLQTIALAFAIAGGMVLISMPIGIWLSESKNKYTIVIFDLFLTLVMADFVFNLVKGDLLAKIGVVLAVMLMGFIFFIRPDLKRAKAT